MSAWHGLQRISYCWSCKRTHPPATICDHDLAKEEPLSRLTIGAPCRDSGLTSPVSRDCVSGASPCEVVFIGNPGIVDREDKTEAVAMAGRFAGDDGVGGSRAVRGLCAGGSARATVQVVLEI